MFKRRDIPPVLLLLLLIILVMLTLSQILVVHNGRYGKNVHNMRKLQLELREMDINLHSLMMQNVPSIELNRRLLQNEINAGRIAAIIAQASKTQKVLLERGRKTEIPREMRHHREEAYYKPYKTLKSEQQESTKLSEQEQTSAQTDKSNENLVLINYLKTDLPLSSNKSRLGRSQLKPQSPSVRADPTPLRGSNLTSLSSSNASDISTKTQSSPISLGSHKALPSSLISSNNNSVLTVHSSPQSTSSNNLGNGTRSVGKLDNSQPPVMKEAALLPNGRPPQNSKINLPQNRAIVKTQLVVSKAESIKESTRNPVLRKFSSSSSSTSKLKKFMRINYCPSIPPNLKGRVFVNFDHKHNFTEEEIVRQNPHIQPGGMSRPNNCIARHRVAVVVPYRDRWDHLMILLSHLHPILERQQLDYRILVVEQSGRDTFNKARIMNIAFVEALKQNNFQCFVFHDVDLVPEDDRNMYSCPTQPRHMSVAIDEMGYKLAYQELVGGVLNMRTEHFQRVNGYSNLYWGWGAEDDDMAYRIMHVGLKITRPPEGVARYKMVKHTKRKPADWRKRAKLLYTGTRRFQFDGLNSLQYKVVHIKKLPLFTHVLVDIGKPPRGF